MQRHLNKLRWATLSVVFAMLMVLPALYVYQTYVAAHAYDLLAPSERALYDALDPIVGLLTDDPRSGLDAVKGTTWSGTLLGYRMSDPLAVASQLAAAGAFNWAFVATALVPLVFTLVLGRVFCGWLCPATFLYELNSNFGALLRRSGVHTGNRRLDRRLKYLVLGAALAVCFVTGAVWTAAIYPPAIVGRELYYAVAEGGLGAGAIFFAVTLAFDLLVARRGFCRVLCPGGALYSALGRYRLVRVQRRVAACNDCLKCTGICEFGLDPARDGFGQECNNCTACIAVCPTDALAFRLAPRDRDYQGPGHLGSRYRRSEAGEGRGDVLTEAA